MRYPASEKLEIIRLVEESALPVRRTLEKVGIPRHLLPLVRSVPGRWAGSPGRPTSQTRCGSSARPFAPNLTSVGRAIHQEISS
jgi:hypothetical protein